MDFVKAEEIHKAHCFASKVSNAQEIWYWMNDSDKFFWESVAAELNQLLMAKSNE